MPSVDDIPPFVMFLDGPGAGGGGDRVAMLGERPNDKRHQRIESLKRLCEAVPRSLQSAVNAAHVAYRTSGLPLSGALALGPKRPRGFAYSGAIKPPSPEKVKRWLRLQQQGGGQTLSNGQRLGKNAGLSRQDPNTGALIPGTPEADAHVLLSTPPPTGGSLDEMHLPGGSLQGTPALPLSPAIDQNQESQQGNMNTTSMSNVVKASGADESLYEVDGVPVERPASPKYDGRTFFQSAAYLQSTAADKGRGQGSTGALDASDQCNDIGMEGGELGWWYNPHVVTAAPTQRAAHLGGRTPESKAPSLPSDNTAAERGCEARAGRGGVCEPSPDQAHQTPPSTGDQTPLGTPPCPVQPGSASVAPSSGHLATAAPPPSTFKGTATIRSPPGGTAQPFSLISPVRPLSGQPTATPPSQR